MSMKIHPRRKSLCRTRQDGRSQARYLKTVPRVGDENYHTISRISQDHELHLKTVPRVGDENLKMKLLIPSTCAFI